MTERTNLLLGRPPKPGTLRALSRNGAVFLREMEGWKDVAALHYDMRSFDELSELVEIMDSVIEQAKLVAASFGAAIDGMQREKELIDRAARLEAENEALREKLRIAGQEAIEQPQTGGTNDLKASLVSSLGKRTGGKLKPGAAQGAAA